MKKRIIYGMICLIICFLCACSSPADEPAAPAATAEAEAVPTPSPTPVPAPTPSPEELCCAEAEVLLEQGEFALAAETLAGIEGEEADALRLRIESAALRAQFRDAQVGDHIFFGSYEQDNDPENGAEPIEWRVIDRQEDRLFVLSEYILDKVPYHEVLEDVTWESCSLRKWLNEDFLSSSFSTAEQLLIPVVTIENQDNPFVLTEGGNDTDDRIALPSIDELHQLLGWEVNRQAKDAVTKKSGWYWMRTIGLNHTNPAYISYDGTFNYCPHLITEAAGIRPVLYIELGEG